MIFDILITVSREAASVKTQQFSVDDGIKKIKQCFDLKFVIENLIRYTYSKLIRGLDLKITIIYENYSVRQF